MQFFGGGGGAPKAQWERTGDRQDAKPALATGKIDVMTFGHLVAENGQTIGCDFEDYRRWMDLALEQNPEIRFFIQDLWPWLPGSERTADFAQFDLAEYEAWMNRVTADLGILVNRLNEIYGGRVKVLPVGPAMVELVKMALNGQLPGVDAILAPAKDRGRVGLYRDKIHPTNVAATLQGYIYFASLYGENPANLQAGAYKDAKLDRILRTIAWKAVTASDAP